MQRLRRATTDRHKVFMAVTVLTVATIAVVEILTVGAARTQLIKRTDSTLQSQANTAAAATSALSPKQLAQLGDLVIPLIRPESSITVFDPDGKTVFSSPMRDGRSSASPVLPALPVLKTRIGKPFTVAGTGGVAHFRVVAKHYQTQTIVFGSSLSGVDRTIHSLERVALLAGAVAVALLGLVVWRLLAAATRPVDAMIDVATRIGDGDFSARVDPDTTHGDAARLGTALNQMTARIEQAFAEKSESEETLRLFVADASHELRTPLTSIRGYAQLLRRGASGDEADLGLARIESEATRMSNLVDDLLLLARLDQGRPLSQARVDVAELVAEVASDARVVEPERPLTTELPAEAPYVLGDEDRLRQVFANLVSNVRRYTSSDTNCVVRVRATGTEVAVTVADNGPGMSEVDGAHAFDRFYRADAARNRDSGGTGLGLAIAKAIVEAHGGTIGLTTAPGAGTTVDIRLPRIRGQRPELRSRADEAAVSSPG